MARLLLYDDCLFADELLPALDIHAFVGLLVELAAVHVVEGGRMRGSVSRWRFDAGTTTAGNAHGLFTRLLELCLVFIGTYYVGKHRRSKQQGGVGVALSMVAADDTVHGVFLSAVHDLRGVFRSDRTQCQSVYITSGRVCYMVGSILHLIVFPAPCSGYVAGRCLCFFVTLQYPCKGVYRMRNH